MPIVERSVLAKGDLENQTLGVYGRAIRQRERRRRRDRTLLHETVPSHSSGRDACLGVGPPRRNSFVERQPTACKSFASQDMTSDRNQPIPRPWYRRFRGKPRSNTILASSQRGRRVRRATSRALKSCSQSGKRSLTHGDSTTVWAHVVDCAGERTFAEFINDLHVWLRSLRAKLSLSRVDYPKSKDSRSVIRGIFRETILAIGAARNRCRFFQKAGTNSSMSGRVIKCRTGCARGRLN